MSGFQRSGDGWVSALCWAAVAFIHTFGALFALGSMRG